MLLLLLLLLLLLSRASSQINDCRCCCCRVAQKYQLPVDNAVLGGADLSVELRQVEGTFGE